MHLQTRCWAWTVGVATVALAVSTSGCRQPEPLRPPAYEKRGISLREPGTGARPEAPYGFKPRKDLPAWDASLPIDWTADPFKDRNWRFQLHAWRSMDYWLGEFDDRGDPAVLKNAVAIALDWERFNIEEGRESTYTWYDMATGIRASVLAFLLDVSLSGELRVNDAELEVLMRLVDVHAAKLTDPDFFSLNNHGISQLVGLDRLCDVASWRRSCEGARSYARRTFVELARSQFSDQGVHVENSPSYHSFALRELKDVRDSRSFGTPEVDAVLENAEKIYPWLTFPDGKLAAVGDSTGGGRVLEGPIQPSCLEGGACFAMGDLTDSGYAIVRSLPGSPDERASMLFVNATGTAPAHKHADELGFEWMELGRKLVVDSGKFGYKSGRERHYFLSARAHSVPSLPERRLGPRDVELASTRLGPIRTDGDAYSVSGSVVRPDAFRHDRRFIYVPGARLEIEDRLQNQTDLAWDSNLHLASDLAPSLTPTGFSAPVGDHVLTGEFEGAGCELRIAHGETDPLQGWVSTGYLERTPASVVIAACPADLVETRWRLSLERRQ